MKNIRNKFLKLNKAKRILLIVLSVILLLSAILFTNNLIIESKLKNPDKVTEELLKTFYTEKSNSKMAKVILGQDSNKYFKNLEKDLYTKVYNQLKFLGDAPVIEGEDIIKIANEYSEGNMKLLKRVKEYKIESKMEVDGGYSYTVNIIPADLTYIYDIKNVCIQKEERDYPEDNYKTLINYYCTKEAMKEDSNKNGAETLVTIVVKKDKKGHYIPTQESLNTLLAVAI